MYSDLLLNILQNLLLEVPVGIGQDKMGHPLNIPSTFVKRLINNILENELEEVVQLNFQKDR